MRRGRVVVIVLAAAVAVLAVVVVTVYAFGTPQAPTSPAGQTTVTQSAVPAPDPSSPLAIEIPGCVCHSEDPAVVEEHADYRMNQCFGCHADGVPEMGQ